MIIEQNPYTGMRVDSAYLTRGDAEKCLGTLLAECEEQPSHTSYTIKQEGLWLTDGETVTEDEMKYKPVFVVVHNDLIARKSKVWKVFSDYDEANECKDWLEEDEDWNACGKTREANVVEIYLQ